MAAASVDTVLDKLSRCHVVIFVFAFIRGLPVTWNLMMPVFVAPSAVEFRCADALNETVATSSDGGHEIWTNNTAQCFHSAGTNASEPCESWVYDRSVYGKTVTEEWNMVCSNRWMVSSSQSIYLAGMVVGTVAASHISDWFGRKNTILGGIVLSVAASTMTAFSTSVTMYYISRFIVALGISGYADVIYTLIMETVSPRYRYMPTMTMGNGWTTGMLLLPWLHYLTRDWRATQLYAALPLAPLFVLGCFLPESPRWLMAMGRFPAAKQVVIKFARNAPAHVVDDIIDEAKRQKAAARDIGRASIADLFSTKVWARRTTLFSFQLIISSLVWYHMTVSTAGVGGNPYVNFAIGASSEYPVKLINVVLIKYFRRRFTICGTMCFSALVMVALWLLPREYSWLRLGLLMLGKVGTSVNGAVLRVQLSETYPTVVRSVAMGFCYTLGRLGSALAPFFDDLGEATQPWVPSVVSAGLCIAGAGASWLLPESFQKTLEDGFSNGEAAVNEAAATTTSSPKQVYVLEMTHF
ncbi:organic cation transporter protein-like isoform X1 [Dermacentor albipictus]|uniref:organic cation transporter protein-like isoform X1 n=1 Tax=Dermacentor albipictus TaxID=60249 RepID=UPI0038FC8AAF